MALRPRPIGQIPIIISDGNAHLLNHNQISDFEGIFVIAFTQDSECASCINAVYAGSSRRRSDIDAMLVVMQNSQ